MNRQTLLWTLVAFFGASIVFNAIIRATDDQPVWLTILLELAVLAVIVGLLVAVTRRRR